MGHEVEARPSLAKGLDALDKDFYDVVYLDVDLPDGNGLLSIPAITERDRPPEVIIFTGASYPNGAELAIKNGAWDYIEKPATAESMLGIVTRDANLLVLSPRKKSRPTGRQRSL